MVGTGVNLVLAIYHHRRLIDKREKEEQYEKKCNTNSKDIKQTITTNNDTKNHDNIFLEIFKIW
jgi:cell division protein FtsL